MHTTFCFLYTIFTICTIHIGADSVSYGYLQTFVSILLLIGGPIIGQLTDKLGSKFTLILCQFGSALSYLTLGLASNLTMLFISRIVTITQQVMQTAQACINQQFKESQKKTSKKKQQQDSDSINKTNKSEEATGRLSMSYGIGMIFGALIGGLVVKTFDIRTNTYLSTLISLGIGIIDIIFLPTLKATSENKTKESTQQQQQHKKKNKNNTKKDKRSDSEDEDDDDENKGLLSNNERNNSNTNSVGGLKSSLYEIYELSMRSNVLIILIFLFIGSMGVSIYRSMFSLIFKDVFKLEASNIGYYIAYIMTIATLSNTFLISRLKEKFENNVSVIIEYCCIILTCCFFIFGNICYYTSIYPQSFIARNNLWFLCILAIPQSVYVCFVSFFFSFLFFCFFVWFFVFLFFCLCFWRCLGLTFNS